MSVRFFKVSTHQELKLTEALAKEIWTHHYTPIIGKAQVEYMLRKFQTSEAIREQIDGGYEYYLIYKDKTAVGYFSTLAESPSLFLSKIYVKAELRGQGIGKSAMEFIEKQARQKGLTAIRLTVNKHNRSSIEAYLKMGFKKTRELVIDIGGGFVMDDYEMVKELN